VIRISLLVLEFLADLFLRTRTITRKREQQQSGFGFAGNHPANTMLIFYRGGGQFSLSLGRLDEEGRTNSRKKNVLLLSRLILNPLKMSGLSYLCRQTTPVAASLG
jgi:hypothetical protein